MARFSDKESQFGGSQSFRAADEEQRGLLSDRSTPGTYGEGRAHFQNTEYEEETNLVLSGRSAAEVTFTDKTKRSFIHRHRGVIGVLLVLVTSAVVGVAIYYGVNTAEESKESDIGPTSLPITAPAPTCGEPVPSSDRVDCYPHTDRLATEPMCTARGCCWDESAPVRGGGAVGVPACYYPRYTPYQLAAHHQYPGFERYVLMLVREYGGISPYPDPAELVYVDVYQQTESRLRVKISTPDDNRYEVPLNLYDGVRDPSSPENRYTFSHHLKQPDSLDLFTFTVQRRGDGSERTIFNSSAGPLIFTNQFMQLTAKLPSPYVYGLGEHVDNLLHSVNWTQLTLFSRDTFPDDRKPSEDLYGVHPVYMNIESDGKAHGVLLLNSNAMDVILSPSPAITYRTTGGVLDFYFFMGPTPDQVVQQYTQLVGKPFMPAYWALGFHLCRWGYETSNHTKEVVERMRAAEMPYDVQWNDIDYMADHEDFTYDEERYGGLPQLVENLHRHGQRYVMIVDPGIANRTTNKWYANGLAMNIFIKDHNGVKPIIGKVWPDTTAFPDFTHDLSTLYWTTALQDFHADINFDGIWIDMNEPSNFVDGSVDGCPQSPLNTPPYVPAALDNLIYRKTLCMTARQATSTHYNLHSLYGHTEAVATMSALTDIREKRGIVISRSTFSGSGNHTGHWLGDNASEWPDMAESIPGMLDFSIFGIPLVGADICGFRGNSTEKLCMRWMQLGSFYPFSRNHNILGAEAQDPAAPRFSEAFRNSTRSALLMRYRLLPYLYTLFFMAATRGSSVARPLFFEYPTDINTLANHRQFLWGSDLLISPVLTEDAVTVDAYFPGGTWYDLRTGEAVVSNGTTKTVNAPLDIIPLHIREGAILPTQEPNVTTNSSRMNPFGVMVAVGEDGRAFGQLYFDDGETLKWYSGKSYTLVNFTFLSEPEMQLRSSIVHQGYHGANTLLIRDFTFYGTMVKESMNVTVHIDDDRLPSQYVTVDPANNVLRITVPTTEQYRQPISQAFVLSIGVEEEDLFL